MGTERCRQLDRHSRRERCYCRHDERHAAGNMGGIIAENGRAPKDFARSRRRLLSAIPVLSTVWYPRKPLKCAIHSLDLFPEKHKRPGKRVHFQSSRLFQNSVKMHWPTISWIVRQRTRVSRASFCSGIDVFHTWKNTEPSREKRSGRLSLRESWFTCRTSNRCPPGGGCWDDTMIDVAREDASGSAQLFVSHPPKPPARFLRAGCHSECNATVNFFCRLGFEILTTKSLPIVYNSHIYQVVA